MEMINADAMCELCGEPNPIKCSNCKLPQMERIEAEPVRHGRWIVKDGRIVCDQCDAVYAVLANGEDELLDEDLQMVYKTEKFCFNCGAKMDNEHQPSFRIFVC